MRPLGILTWHVHGSYLYYLVQSPHEFYLPVKKGRPESYGGRARRHALERYNIHRFRQGWNQAFALVTGCNPVREASPALQGERP